MKGATCRSISPQDFCSAAVPYQLRSHCRARSAVLSKSETPKAVNSGATPGVIGMRKRFSAVPAMTESRVVSSSCRAA